MNEKKMKIKDERVDERDRIKIKTRKIRHKKRTTKIIDEESCIACQRKMMNKSRIELKKQTIKDNVFKTKGKKKNSKDKE